MTIWRVTFTLDDTIPAQANILATIQQNVTILTNPANLQSLFQIQKTA